MPRGVKIALPGYNAETDTDPAHFSLYVDGTTDHVLVKEKSRGVSSVADFNTQTIAHNLGYFPFFMACAESPAELVEEPGDEFEWVNGGFNLFGGYYQYVTTSDLLLGNREDVTKDFTYIIFHDQL